MNVGPVVSEAQIASRALQIALRQSSIPVSPGRVNQDGEVLLCAAACFAAAGLEYAFGAGERERFARNVAYSKDKDLVYQAFERLGWPKVSCIKKMEPND